MMNNIFTLIITGFMLINLHAQQRPVIRVDEVVQRYGQDSTFVVLDVRTPPELEGPLGKIEGVINIPLQQLNDRLSELEPYKEKEIAVICRSGNRSGVATEILIKNGYNARNVTGGMIEYRKNTKN